MQDNYVGDIGDYGKYGLLRHVTAASLRLAVNWYRMVPTRPGKQEDGKYISTCFNQKSTDTMNRSCLTA